MKLVSAKCPNCGANVKLDADTQSVECEYCKQTINVEKAIENSKVKIDGTVSVEGIASNSDLIKAANDLLEMGEFLKAKRKFQEFSEKCPNDYQGWLGLLICRTRNFTIKDNNVLFENEINQYYDHFMSVAPDDIKKEYEEKFKKFIDEKETKSSGTPKKEKISTNSKMVWWILGWIFCFPIPAGILIWRRDWNKIVKVVLIAFLCLIYLGMMKSINSGSTETVTNEVVNTTNVVTT